MSYESAVAARDDEGFARDPGRIAGGQENHRASDVPRLANATEWRLRFDLLAHIAFRNAGRVRSFRFHHAGPNGVDANFARAEFRGERTRDRIHRPFRATVNRPIGKSFNAGYRTDVDDVSTSRIEQPYRGLRSEDQAEHIQIEMLVEVLLRHVFERGEFIDARVVDQNVEPDKGSLRLGEQPLDVGLPGNIS